MTRHGLRWCTLAVAVMAANAFCATPSPALSLVERSWNACRAGHLSQARELASKAYSASRTSALTRLAYASLGAPLEQSVALLESVANDTSANDTIRAAACDRLGGKAYIEGKLAEALRWYRAAIVIRAEPARIRRLALTHIADSAWHQADSVANLAEPSGARYLQAMVLLARGDFDGGLGAFRAAVPDAAVQVAAVGGAAVCADRLGYITEAQHWRAELARLWPDALESGVIQRTFSALPVPVSPRPVPQVREPHNAPAVAASAPPGGAFTVQVGSFGTLTNADRQAGQMKKHFDDVRVVQAQVGSSIMYRVRVGHFATQQDAEAFAAARISSLGISYKVLAE